MKVSVIGGAGRVGLGMCLVLAESGHFVYGVDLDEEKNALVSSGIMPFYEEGGEEYLGAALKKQRLKMTSDLSVISDSEVVIVVIGTPIDSNFNPVVGPLHDLVSNIAQYLRPGQLIILRSTVSPGTTDLVKRLLEEATGFSIGRDLYLVSAPERVAEGKTIVELTSLPQLIGAYDQLSYSKAETFFQTFLHAQCLSLSPLEAEIGKLITNMTRYVTFALSNEYHLIAETFGVNINKIIDACNEDYPRLDLPSPGPNVGGPCLYKDGWFLIERVAYNELISTAFRINEGMPMQIVQKIRQYADVRKVAILGMTFKANSDDTRNSLSYKLKKQLDSLCYELVLIDPHVKTCAPLTQLAGSDAVILMTPHDEFENLREIVRIVDNPNCLYVDIWGYWTEMKYCSRNGYFWGKEVSHEDFGFRQRRVADAEGNSSLDASWSGSHRS
ncbi:MAG: nucleotide sugar dehydrogenase [Chloroflexi bacterium]|nr:nucleotide sugar dehydrogenase [Chloroflexota bacterium]